jgi:hypothetical protein
VYDRPMAIICGDGLNAVIAELGDHMEVKGKDRDEMVWDVSARLTRLKMVAEYMIVRHHCDPNRSLILWSNNIAIWKRGRGSCK